MFLQLQWNGFRCHRPEKNSPNPHGKEEEIKKVNDKKRVALDKG